MYGADLIKMFGFDQNCTEDVRIVKGMLASGEAVNLSPVMDRVPQNDNDQERGEKTKKSAGCGAYTFDRALIPRTPLRRTGRRSMKLSKLGTAAIVNKLTMKKTTKTYRGL